jgi:nicotinate phosphoribosyltransferase
MKPIITSLLDTDLYKFKMLYFYWKMGMTDLTVSYAYKNRGDNDPFTFIDMCELGRQFTHLRTLKLTYNELIFLHEIFKDIEFINWLSTNKFEWDGMAYGSFNGKLGSIILYEVPVMAIINELYSKKIQEGMGRYTYYHEQEFRRKLGAKIKLLSENPEVCFTEFGSRRRSSKKFQEIFLEECLTNIPEQLIGTSNVLMAQKYNIPPVGTIAHEVPMLFATAAHGNFFKDRKNTSMSNEDYMMLCQSLRNSQYMFILNWDKIFPHTYYLTDTYGTKWFLNNMSDHIFGLRQDSGLPDRFVELLKSSRFNGKPIMFSDGLDVEEMVRLHSLYKNSSFGWGTNATNDGVIEPLKIVIKLFTLDINNHQIQSVKLSDNPNKAIGNDITLYKNAFDYNITEIQDIHY